MRTRGQGRGSSNGSSSKHGACTDPAESWTDQRPSEGLTISRTPLAPFAWNQNEHLAAARKVKGKRGRKNEMGNGALPPGGLFNLVRFAHLGSIARQGSEPVTQLNQRREWPWKSSYKGLPAKSGGDGGKGLIAKFVGRHWAANGNSMG